MTAAVLEGESALPEEARHLLHLPADDTLELACKAHLGVWSERKRHFVHGDVQWEWNELAMTKQRLALIAPREHAKSETFSVNQIAWRCIYTPGIWCYLFAQTGDQAKLLKARIDAAIGQAAPWMLEGEQGKNSTHTTYANFAQIDVAGSGKSVRGLHPDIIVGDDVLEEGNCMTSVQRKHMERWWFGTIGGMAHPGTTRTLGNSPTVVSLPPTRVHLVGTPFHSQDLLMGMRDNPLYEWRRYAAEFQSSDLAPGTLAVEVA